MFVLRFTLFHFYIQFLLLFSSFENIDIYNERVSSGVEQLQFNRENDGVEVNSSSVSGVMKTDENARHVQR